MELIESKKKRMRTFTSRKQGIIKKASELSKLCNVETAVIIFGPNGNESVHAWPNEPEKLNIIIKRYLNTNLEDRRRRALNLSSFMDKGKKSAPAQEQEHDHHDDGIHNMMMAKNPTLDDRIDGFSVEQLMELLNCLDAKIGLLESRIEVMKRGNLGQEQVGYLAMQPNLGFGFSVDDHQYHHEDQKMNAELMKQMMLRMMMINGGGSSNPIDVNVGDYGTGLIGMEGLQNQVLENVNGGMLDVRPLSWNYDSIDQLHSCNFNHMLL